jgi:Ca-activated chloride channel family protein
MSFWQDIRGFYFAWPWALLLFAFIPLCWWIYLRDQRRQLEQIALSFSYTALVQRLKRQPSPWKRLLHPLTASGIASLLILSLARPTVIAKVPISTVDMMLVMDISLSMMADDIKPDRMSAAREAAIRFVESLPRDARIGLEFFAGDNYVLSAPTGKHSEIIDYLRALNKNDLKLRTEIGSALRSALEVLEKTRTGVKTSTRQGSPTEALKAPERVIVLLSDGDSHEGYPWETAAQEAKSRNVVIHTVGIGSAEGGTITYQGMELPVNFSELTLRKIAEMAGGQYFRVFKSTDFRTVYEQIRERTLHYEERDVDVSFALAGMGLLLLLLAFMLNRNVQPL